MRRRHVLAAAGAAAVASAGLALGPMASHPALAAGRAPALELRVIHASRSDGGASVDPQLRDLQLSKEPFVRYNVYALLERQRFALEPGKPVVHALINGRTLRVSLDGIAEDAGEPRYRMEAQIAEAG